MICKEDAMKALFTGRFTAFLSATALSTAALFSMPATGDWMVDEVYEEIDPDYMAR